MPLDTAQFGEPVAIGQISSELKKLWDTGDGRANTRASLVNFAIYSRDLEKMEANTRLIAEFTRQHACRALLVCVQRAAPEPRVSAWINAHCHVGRAGAKQVCCEQITFLLEGEIKGRLTNIVFSNLDSDLPLYFWMQGDLSEQLNPNLWTWIDRLIVDSLVWRDPKAQFQRLRASISETKSRLTLRDLNWTRSLYLRQAISQIFDHPDNLPHLSQLERITITHAPANHSTAVLLLGWFAGQLGWTLKSASPVCFTTGHGREVAVEFRTADGPAISAVQLSSSDADFTLTRDASSRFLRTDVRLPGDHEFHYLLPGGPEEIVDLLDEEMTRGSRHSIYLKALTIAEPLL